MGERSESSSELGFYLCDIARMLACAAGVPSACLRPGHFLLRAQEKVTKEKGNPEYPLCRRSLQSTRRDYGVFRQGILP
jgi:hypothetical protein